MEDRSWKVPYVALGDSLTHGVQSLGVAEISQRKSYPAQIAQFLHAEPFTQPLMKGDIDSATGRSPDGKVWVGNPVNLELVLRAAAALNDAANKGHTTSRVKAHPGIKAALQQELGTAGGVLSEALLAAINAVEDTDPADFLVAGSGPAENGYYQNLGVYGFCIGDILVRQASPALAQPAGVGARFARFGRHALESVAQHWDRLTGTHPSFPLALALTLLAWSEGTFFTRLDEEKLGYVLPPVKNADGSLTYPTAFQAMAEQRPHLVTLLIGANHLLPYVLSAKLYDGATSPPTPLFTRPDDFERQLNDLVERILSVDSTPYLFIATLPSPTSSPNLVRDRLGRWKPLVPTYNALVDDAILEIEDIVRAYNAAIRRLSDRTEKPFRDEDGKSHVWIVDLYALYARMQRATRHDAEAARRAVAHAVRSQLITRDEGSAALRAARSGNLDTIRYLRRVDAALMRRSFNWVDHSDPDPIFAGVNVANDSTLRRALTKGIDAPDVETFRVELQSDFLYRLTGDFLAADPTDGPNRGLIAQGGAVGLDALHLTNTAYAYVAREFIKAIYKANESDDRILKAFDNRPTSWEAFDTTLLETALADTLLNDVPPSIPEMMNLLSVITSSLGDQSYIDPVLAHVTTGEIGGS
jgi:hypothetical protein